MFFNINIWCFENVKRTSDIINGVRKVICGKLSDFKKKMNGYFS